jgi:serine/threonine protein kinase
MAFPRPFGRYVLEMRIAMGGMAEIFRARMDNEGFQKRVCIKCVLPHFLENESFVTMFRDEAALAAKLQHANIVQVFDFGEHEGSLFLAMEYIDGADLKRLLTLSRENGRPLSLGQVLQVGIEVSRGLYYAHTLEEDGRPLGLVHRDVSPHNILVSRQGEVKLTDFGIAKAAARATHTQTGVVKGKLAYMAPEQAEGTGIDHRVDQFALGVVLWEALTGERLFAGGSEAEVLKKVLLKGIPDPREHVPDLPEGVAQVIMAMLARDPNDRFKDMRALERALTKLQFDVTDDPAQSDLRAPVQSLLELSVPTPRRTAILPATDPPLDGSGSIMSLTDAGFTKAEDLEGDSGVFASDPGQPRIDLTHAADTGAKTALIDGSASNPPLAATMEGGTGVTRTLVPEEPLTTEPMEPLKTEPMAPLVDTEATERIRDRHRVAAPAPAPARAAWPWVALGGVGALAAVGVVALLMAKPDEAAPPPAPPPEAVAAPALAPSTDPPPADPPATEPPVAAEPPVAKPKPRPKRRPKPKPRPVLEPTPTAADPTGPATKPPARKPKAPGSVFVDVVGSWAAVYARGKKQCDTPCRFELPAGKHRITLKGPDGDRTETVRVRSGAEKRLIIR